MRTSEVQGQKLLQVFQVLCTEMMMQKELLQAGLETQWSHRLAGLVTSLTRECQSLWLAISVRCQQHLQKHDIIGVRSASLA